MRRVLRDVLDRYTAPYENFVRAAPRWYEPYRGPRRAERAKRDWQPAMGSAGYQGQSPWLAQCAIESGRFSHEEEAVHEALTPAGERIGIECPRCAYESAARSFEEKRICAIRISLSRINRSTRRADW